MSQDWEWDQDQTIWKQLYEVLRKRIETGVYPSRSPVPSLDRLQQEFGVARVTVQKVMRILKSEGMIKTIVGKGTFVRPPEEWGQSLD
ncbi:winged helix-turn-helix domain-containing protein [Streptosporangium sp. NPDC051023]|uniref:winged helix-turn-helix domain-containing protein n=1 Tax=Streptosporangium sp. NPDC051023 TaxID=3155410 RepID=UPI00344CA30F